jgi:hypothetical protein
MPLNKVKGLRTRKFEGSGYENYSRLRFTSGRNISGGILTQKDLGENDFLDHYSGFLQWVDTKNKYKIILGNYQVHLGHGLAFSSPYSIQKSVFALAPLRFRSIGGRPFLSSSESTGFTGLFAHYAGLNYFTFDLFYSSNLRDATFDDSRTLLTGLEFSGYHRSESEIDKMDLLKENVIGSHAKINIFEYLDMGLTYARVDFKPSIIFDNRTQSENALRRDYYHFNGDQINLYSVYFNYHIGVLSINGEMASNSFKKFSQSYHLLLQKNSSGIGFKWWHIPAQFQSPFGRAFASSQAFPRGRQGFYTGIKHILSEKISVSSYWTTEKKLWRTYFDPLSTISRDFLFNININLAEKTDLALKYKFSNNQSYSSELRNSFREFKRKFRLDIIKHITKEIRVRSRVEKVLVNYSQYFAEKQGINFYQDIRWQLFPFATITARYSSFETADYDSRIYEFENDLPGTFSNYALYGKGSKWYLLLKLEFWKNVRLWIKYRSIYFDGVETIGSGYMEIEGNSRQDFRVQFSYSY